MKNNELKTGIIEIAKGAQQAFRSAFGLPTAVKNKAIRDMAYLLNKKKRAILKANKKDVESARKSGLSSTLIDRLILNEKRIAQMCDSLIEIAKLPDYVGQVIKEWKNASGLLIKKVRVPIGVIAIIYESRPNVTSDCIGLCFKSGNSVILRGGSEALNSNTAIYGIIKEAVKKYSLPGGMINMITTKDRRAVDALLKLNNYIDLVMPRGGESLINKVVESSRIPVIKHYKGICHVYADKQADLKKAENICFNAKVQRPGVCNAMESMLVHKDIAGKFLPVILHKLSDAGVEIRGCDITRGIFKKAKKATEEDYRTEYLGLILSVKVVNDLAEAVNHINYYGSHHSDSIVTENKKAADDFLKKVDSACVYHNASTRFTDGYQFGMGAEIGISTDKLHARGPMALEELTTYKYVVYGNGQIRK
jgi:glutamate-5-semialdehyde dehydrogenase